MIPVNITVDQVDLAKSLAKTLGALKNSITRGDGNVAGILGEIVVADYLGVALENTYDYDLIGVYGEKIDVKTKRTTRPPLPHYDCSVAAFNTKQKCDKYVFVRVLSDLSVAWVLGYKGKEDYFRSARLMRKGEVDPANNFTVKSDCYNLSIKNLDSIEELV